MGHSKKKGKGHQKRKKNAYSKKGARDVVVVGAPQSMPDVNECVNEDVDNVVKEDVGGNDVVGEDVNLNENVGAEGASPDSLESSSSSDTDVGKDATEKIEEPFLAEENKDANNSDGKEDEKAVVVTSEPEEKVPDEVAPPLKEEDDARSPSPSSTPVTEESVSTEAIPQINEENEGAESSTEGANSPKNVVPVENASTKVIEETVEVSDESAESHLIEEEEDVSFQPEPVVREQSHVEKIAESPLTEDEDVLCTESEPVVGEASAPVVVDSLEGTENKEALHSIKAEDQTTPKESAEVLTEFARPPMKKEVRFAESETIIIEGITSLNVTVEESEAKEMSHLVKVENTPISKEAVETIGDAELNVTEAKEDLYSKTDLLISDESSPIVASMAEEDTERANDAKDEAIHRSVPTPIVTDEIDSSGTKEIFKQDADFTSDEEKEVASPTSAAVDILSEGARKNDESSSIERDGPTSSELGRILSEEKAVDTTSADENEIAPSTEFNESISQTPQDISSAHIPQVKEGAAPADNSVTNDDVGDQDKPPFIVDTAVIADKVTLNEDRIPITTEDMNIDSTESTVLHEEVRVNASSEEASRSKESECECLDSILTEDFVEPLGSMPEIEESITTDFASDAIESAVEQKDLTLKEGCAETLTESAESTLDYETVEKVPSGEIIDASKAEVKDEILDNAHAEAPQINEDDKRTAEGTASEERALVDSSFENAEKECALISDAVAARDPTHEENDPHPVSSTKEDDLHHACAEKVQELAPEKGDKVYGGDESVKPASVVQAPSSAATNEAAVAEETEAASEIEVKGPESSDETDDLKLLSAQTDITKDEEEEEISDVQLACEVVSTSTSQADIVTARRNKNEGNQRENETSTSCLQETAPLSQSTNVAYEVINEKPLEEKEAAARQSAKEKKDAWEKKDDLTRTPPAESAEACCCVIL